MTRRGSVLTPGMLGILFATVGLLLTCDESVYGLFWSSLLIGVGALLLIWDALLRGWSDRFLLLCFTAFFILTYPVSGIVLYFIPSGADPMLPSDPQSLCLSMQVGGIGWLALTVGYWITLGCLGPPAPCGKRNCRYSTGMGY